MRGGDRAARKFGLRTVLTGLVLLTVILTAVLIHLTWFYAARKMLPTLSGSSTVRLSDQSSTGP